MPIMARMPDARPGVDPSELRARAGRLPAALRGRFLRRISGVEKVPRAARRTAVLEAIAAEIEAAEGNVDRRRRLVPDTLAYPEELPIIAKREELLATIRDHQVVVVAGETGSGKSTQLPKLCLELGRGVGGLIGHTQPRRIAARSIAERVAEELGTSVGGLVGFTVRFTDRVGKDTLIKVMTDGILLSEIHRDRRLGRYDTIILDEAHERSLNIDFLLGYLRTLLARRRDLKLIITSATIDTERFAAHFGGAPVVEVSGRTYPVEIRYRPLDDPVPRDQPQAICDAVTELAGEGPGDVLVFCAGEREIRDAADALTDLGLPHTEVLPLYARLSAAEQHRVFQAHTGRRIVVATNVAETSLTVPGVRSVVDAGTARISRYGRRTKVQRLPIEPISRASADQRAGRCGRLGPGICIRLYDRRDYETRPEFTEPEILRTNLASVILQMAALDLGEVASFPFLDPPDARTIRDGVALLEELGAVDPAREGTGRWLTPLGRQLARLPVDPRLGRIVLEGGRIGCLAEVLVITAALSIQDPRERPQDEEARADEMHARFRVEGSDLLGWLPLWEYLHEERRERSSSRFRAMCREEFLNYRRVREWQDIHAQLAEAADELGLRVNQQPASPDTVHRALLAGLLSQVGRKDPDGYEYRGARGTRFAVSPGSVLFRQGAEWVMAAEMVETTRLWAREAARFPAEWLEEVGAHLVRRSHGDPWWDPERGAAVARETVTLFGIPVVERTVLYGRVDPEASRDLFIRHALVLGEWETHHAFAEDNRARVEEVIALEARERRTGLLADEDTLVEVFSRRLPAGITSTREFDRWWRDARRGDPNLLHLTLDDLIDPAARLPDEEAFPSVWRHGDVAMPVAYEFDPDSPTDGITIDVPLGALDRLDPGVFGWHVPGRRAEVVEVMIRSLPKEYRRAFVPIPETAAEIARRLAPGSAGSIAEALRRELTRLGGRPIPPGALDPGGLPSYLRPRFRVVGEDGTPLAEGDDLAALKEALLDEARAAASGHPLEQSGLTEWSYGELPRTIEIGTGRHRTPAYPALVDEGSAVGIRLLATPEEQATEMWAGSRRLLLLSLPSPAALLRPLLTDRAKQRIREGPYDDPQAWIEDCLACTAASILDDHGGPPWDAVGFDDLIDRAYRDFPDRAVEIGQRSLEILDTLADVRSALADLRGDRFEEAAADVEAQIDRLAYPGFLTGIGAARLPDVHRYLRAAQYRLERLPADPARDAAHMAVVRRLEAEHDRLLDALPASPDLLDIAWMLQELRVSFFAQPLGTRGKVSEKRIAAALDAAIGR